MGNPIEDVLEVIGKPLVTFTCHMVLALSETLL